MKKTLFSCFLILGTLAYSNEEYIENISIEDEEVNIPNLRGGNSEFDVLGRGYDMSGDYLSSKSVRAEVIDVQS